MPCESCAHLDFTCPDYADLLVPISTSTSPESDTPAGCPDPADAGAHTMDRLSPAGAGARTNAGELVDAALHEGWQGIAADPWALERFGRSASL